MMNDLVFTMKGSNRFWNLCFSHTATEWIKRICVDVQYSSSFRKKMKVYL